MTDLLFARIERRPPTYELRDGGVPIGTLRYPSRTSSRAEAEVPSGGWQMPARRAFQPTPAIVSRGGAEVGLVHRRHLLSGADFELDGTSFELRKTRWWRRTWVLRTDGEDLLALTARTLSGSEPLAVDAYAPLPPSVVLLAAHLVLVAVQGETFAAVGAASAGAAGS